MRDIVIAGIDDKDNSLIKKYIQFYHQDSDENSSWDRTYEIGDTKYDVTNLVSYDDFISECTGIQNSNYELNAPIKKKLASADILVFVSSDSPISRPGSVINSIKNIGFTNTRLVIFANSYNGSLNLGFEEFYQNNLTELFPNALILGFGKNNSAQLSAVIELINSECVLNFVSSAENKDVATIIEDKVFINLLSQSNSSDFFWCNKDYVGGDILKTYDLDKYSFLTKKLSDVVKSWWNYKDIIPYVINYKELTGNELEIVNKIISEDKSFYNNAVLVTKDGKKCIQGKVHYSFVDKYIEAKYNSSKSDIKNILKESHVGVDCSGLVSPLLYETVEEIKKDKNYKEIVKSLDHSNPKWGIKRHDAIVIKEKGSIIVRSVKNVRPGDIMRTTESRSNGDVGFHIKLVIDVKHGEDGSVSIFTIESTSTKYNGLLKKQYLFTPNKDNSFDLEVFNYEGEKYKKESKEYSLVKTQLCEINKSGDQYSYTTRFSKINMVVNTTHIADGDYLTLLSRENDSVGFDHIICDFDKKLPFRSYYFRRPKFLQSFIANVNSDDKPIVDEQSQTPDSDSVSALPTDKVEQAKKVAAHTIQVIKDNIYQYKVIRHISNLVLPSYEKDEAENGTVYKIISCINYGKKRLDDYMKRMRDIEAGYITDETKYPKDFLTGYKTDEEILEYAHYEIFGVKYNKELVKKANELFITYLVLYKSFELGNELKIRQSKIDAKYSDAIYLAETLRKDTRNTDVYLENIRNAELTLNNDYKELFDIVPCNFYDTCVIYDTKLKCKPVIGEYTAFLLSEEMETYRKKLINKAGILSLQAFGYDYCSIIEYEKEIVDDVKWWADLTKTGICLAVALATGGLGGTLLVQASIDAATTFAIDLVDSFGKPKVTAQEVGLDALDGIIAGVFSFGTGKFLQSSIMRAFKNYLVTVKPKIINIFKKRIFTNTFDSESINLVKSTQKELSEGVEQVGKIVGNMEDVPCAKYFSKLDGNIEKNIKSYEELISKLPNEIQLKDNQIAKLQEKLGVLKQETTTLTHDPSIADMVVDKDEVVKYQIKKYRIKECELAIETLKNERKASAQLLSDSEKSVEFLKNLKNNAPNTGKKLEEEIVGIQNELSNIRSSIGEATNNAAKAKELYETNSSYLNNNRAKYENAKTELSEYYKKNPTILEDETIFSYKVVIKEYKEAEQSLKNAFEDYRKYSLIKSTGENMLRKHQLILSVKQSKINKLFERDCPLLKDLSDDIISLEAINSKIVNNEKSITSLQEEIGKKIELLGVDDFVSFDRIKDKEIYESIQEYLITDKTADIDSLFSSLYDTVIKTQELKLELEKAWSSIQTSFWIMEKIESASLSYIYSKFNIQGNIAELLSADSLTVDQMIECFLEPSINEIEQLKKSEKEIEITKEETEYLVNILTYGLFVKIGFLQTFKVIDYLDDYKCLDDLLPYNLSFNEYIIEAFSTNLMNSIVEYAQISPQLLNDINEKRNVFIKEVKSYIWTLITGIYEETYEKKCMNNFILLI